MLVLYAEIIIIIIITHADDSRGSKAFSGVTVCVFVCVCLFVRMHDKTKTAETTIVKLSKGIVYHTTWPII